MITIARWILLGRLRSAGAWALWLLFLAGPLLAAALRPETAAVDPGRSLLAWSFPAGLAGCTLGLVELARGREFLSRVPPRTRWGGELLALAAGATYLQLPIVLAACATGATAADLTGSVPAILILDLRLAATALLLLVPPLPTTLRVCLLLAAAWLVPALASGAPELAPLAAALDAHRGLESAASLPAALALACGLLVPGYLLRTRSAAAGTR